MPINISIIND